MDQKEVASMFKALGDPTRLRIFEFLRSCCCAVAIGDSGQASRTSGPTAGEVCCSVTGSDKINSKISFHLKELRSAGLITMERRGKNMLCGINPDAASMLSAYLSGPLNPDSLKSEIENLEDGWGERCC